MHQVQNRNTDNRVRKILQRLHRGTILQRMSTDRTARDTKIRNEINTGRIEEYSRNYKTCCKLLKILAVTKLQTL